MLKQKNTYKHLQHNLKIYLDSQELEISYVTEQIILIMIKHYKMVKLHLCVLAVET